MLSWGKGSREAFHLRLRLLLSNLLYQATMMAVMATRSAWLVVFVSVDELVSQIHIRIHDELAQGGCVPRGCSRESRLPVRPYAVGQTFHCVFRHACLAAFW
jgi:hypothetical protein